MRFTAEQHFAAAQFVREAAAKLTGEERELFIKKSNTLVVCVLMSARDRGGICMDGFDRTSLTPDWTIIENQLLRLAPPIDEAPPEKRPTRARETSLPEYYVLLCARRYAEMVRKLVVAATAEERRQAKQQLSYIYESGLIEYEREYERRARPFPDDLRRVLIKRDGFKILRSISGEESEIVRYSCAIPAFSLIDILSVAEMQGLADMYEGWAQSDRTDSVNVASLLGWADGFRSLVEVIGADYAPPEAPPGAEVSLIKFMALKMSG